MGKKIIISIASVFIFFTCVTVHAINVIDKLPCETIVLKSPNNSYANWKEINRFLTEKEGMIEYIPSDQRIANWSDLISIQYFDKSSLQKKAGNSIKDAVEFIKESILSSYPEDIVTWRFIQNNTSDIIYEWILHKPFKGVPAQHEVAHAFLTDTGLHRIGFTKKNKEMTFEERAQSIKSLRDFVSVVTIEEAKDAINGLSLVDRVKDSLNLGKTFENWKKVNTYLFERGYNVVLRVPENFKGEYIDECLEITTMPNIYELKIDQVFQAEKMGVQQKSSNPIQFSILKKSATELIYNFTHPQDHLQVTGVVRILLSDQGYYSMSYKRGLATELTPQEIQLWKSRLEDIKIKN